MKGEEAGGMFEMQALAQCLKRCCQSGHQPVRYAEGPAICSVLGINTQRVRFNDQVNTVSCSKAFVAINKKESANSILSSS